MTPPAVGEVPVPLWQQEAAEAGKALWASFKGHQGHCLLEAAAVAVGLTVTVGVAEDDPIWAEAETLMDAFEARATEGSLGALVLALSWMLHSAAEVNEEAYHEATGG